MLFSSKSRHRHKRRQIGGVAVDPNALNLPIHLPTQDEFNQLSSEDQDFAIAVQTSQQPLIDKFNAKQEAASAPKSGDIALSAFTNLFWGINPVLSTAKTIGDVSTGKISNKEALVQLAESGGSELLAGAPVAGIKAITAIAKTPEEIKLATMGTRLIQGTAEYAPSIDAVAGIVKSGLHKDKPDAVQELIEEEPEEDIAKLITEAIETNVDKVYTPEQLNDLRGFLGLYPNIKLPPKVLEQLQPSQEVSDTVRIETLDPLARTSTGDATQTPIDIDMSQEEYDALPYSFQVLVDEQRRLIQPAIALGEAGRVLQKRQSLEGSDVGTPVEEQPVEIEGSDVGTPVEEQAVYELTEHQREHMRTQPPPVEIAPPPLVVPYELTEHQREHMRFQPPPLVVPPADEVSSVGSPITVTSPAKKISFKIDRGVEPPLFKEVFPVKNITKPYVADASEELLKKNNLSQKYSVDVGYAPVQINYPDYTGQVETYSRTPLRTDLQEVDCSKLIGKERIRCEHKKKKLEESKKLKSKRNV